MFHAEDHPLRRRLLFINPNPPDPPDPPEPKPRPDPADKVRVFIYTPKNGESINSDTVQLSGGSNNTDQVHWVLNKADGTLVGQGDVPTDGQGNWSVNVTVPAPGDYSATATPRLGPARPVNFHVAPPLQLTIYSPTPGQVLIDPQAIISGTIDSWKADARLEYSWDDSGKFSPIAYQPNWRVVSDIPSIGNHKMTVRCSDAAGHQLSNSVGIVSVDKTGPVLSIDAPPHDNDTVPFSSSGITASGSCTDTQTGVKLVEYAIDNATTFAAATPKASGDWSGWTAQAVFSAPGRHSITIRAADNAGNTTAITRSILVAIPQKDPLSLQAYLGDLLQYATQNIKVDAAGAKLTEALLQQTYYQSFDGIAAAGDAVTATVRQPRGAIEVLRQYLTSNGVSVKAEDEAVYRQQAYLTLLNKFGTSYDELRLARTADGDSRKRLADRLGIDLSLNRPDQLDSLLLQPDKLTESDLEQIFGLRSSTRQALDQPILVSNYLSWQLQHLRRLWKEQDYPQQTNTPLRPIVDPDVIGTASIKSAMAGNPAFDLWQSRKDWLNAQTTEIAGQRSADKGALENFDLLVGKYLMPTSDLLALYDNSRKGVNTDAALADKQMTKEMFNFIIRLRNLASTSPLLETEWTDLVSLLVQVQKVRNYPAWRDGEQQRGIVLGPDLFAPADSGINPAAPTSRWRGGQTDRQVWQDTVTARIDQQDAMVQANRAAVMAAEEQILPLLRDALMKAVPHTQSDDAFSDLLSERLQIDLKSGGSIKTTRVHQAIQSLQGLLFSLRSGGFAQSSAGSISNPSSAWSLLKTEDQFDKEWRWMGGYDTWRAAMFVFYYLENTLLPSLREEAPNSSIPGSDMDKTRYATPHFRQFVEDVRSREPLTPGGADEAARAYLSSVTSGTQSTSGTPGAPSVPGLPKIDNLPAQLQPPFKITAQLEGAEAFRDRRNLIIALFPHQDNPPAPPKYPENYIQEIFYYVPLYLALELQHSGQYLAALDWYQTVYAYNLPQDQRKIYFGLALEGEDRLPKDYYRKEGWLENLNPHNLAENRANAYTRFTLLSIARCFADFADAEFSRETEESISRARSLYLTALQLLNQSELQTVPTGSVSATNATPFPANPILQALRLHVTLNLTKLRMGKNIAGMQREIELQQTTQGAADLSAIGADGQISVPDGQPLHPTPYYYATLIERAKQLVTIAQQMEASMLAALEKQDIEGYNLLKAQHDLNLANAGVQLQDLRVTEANDGVVLADLQRSKAQTQRDTYNQWIEAGPNQYEQAMLQNYRDALDARTLLAGIDAEMTTTQAFTSAAAGGVTGAPAALPFAALTSVLAFARGSVTANLDQAEAAAQANNFYASYERRTDEWELQRNVAEKDIQIASQQTQAARDHVSVAQEERSVATMQADQAQAMVNFLANKFTNAELYAWMSRILSQVYSYFLQQATSVARLAQSQLSFERQEPVSSYIKSDYWQALSDSGSSTGNNPTTPDRKGLTGSARLLEDIFRLDQYAFDTNKRKLQLSQTFSLGRLYPAEFQQFREIGVLHFTTPLALFDQGFPGHYLRLVRRVRMSIVALIPPTQGIHATLSSSGVSRVITGGDIFQTVVVHRDPELIALTSPMNATGLFELDPQSNMLLPFESMGVDTNWELRLPKAANAFDFRTIADALMTIEYTALHSPDYQDQVVQSLSRNFSAEQSWSIRNEFADEWYNLNNPDQADTPMAIKFSTKADDFPPNLDDLKIQNLLVHFARLNGQSFEVPVTYLKVSRGAQTATLGGATSIDGTISIRKGNAAAWNSPTIIGQSPAADWEVGLANTPDTRDLFQKDQIDDIFFVLTYSAQTPAWV